MLLAVDLCKMLDFFFGVVNMNTTTIIQNARDVVVVVVF